MSTNAPDLARVRDRNKRVLGIVGDANRPPVIDLDNDRAVVVTDPTKRSNRRAARRRYIADRRT